MKKKLGKNITDINVLAKSIVDKATQENNISHRALNNDTISLVMREMGRKGGLKGGKIRAQRLSDSRRSEIARIAANERWQKE